MSNILMTMAEDAAATSPENFGLRYRVDEYDCLDFAESLKNLGHDVFFVNWMDLGAKEFERMFSFNQSRFVNPVPVDDMDLIFVYKMEGFYFDLSRFDAMLERFAASQARVVNDVPTIRHNLDKKYLFELAEKGVQVIPSYPIAEVRGRIAQGETFVIKPRRGERGKGIFLTKEGEELQAIAGMEDDHFAQEFVRSVREGERSLVFLGHKFQHAVIKHPSPSDVNEFRCNESQGGTVAVYTPTDVELAFAQNVLNVYEGMGYPVHFSRIDLLTSARGPLLIEAELLNPSIFANYSKKGREFGEQIGSYFDGLLSTKKKVLLS